MENLKVKAIDTRDSYGRGRFFPFSPDNLIPNLASHEEGSWYWSYVYYPVEKVFLSWFFSNKTKT